MIALDGSVEVCRLDLHVELSHRAGDVIPDGAGGHWHVEEVVLEERCLTVRALAAPVALPRRRTAPARRAA